MPSKFFLTIGHTNCDIDQVFSTSNRRRTHAAVTLKYKQKGWSTMKSDFFLLRSTNKTLVRWADRRMAAQSSAGTFDSHYGDVSWSRAPAYTEEKTIRSKRGNWHQRDHETIVWCGSRFVCWSRVGLTDNPVERRRRSSKVKLGQCKTEKIDDFTLGQCGIASPLSI